MARVSTFGQMDQNMKENGKKTESKDLVCTYGPMEESTQENG